MRVAYPMTVKYGGAAYVLSLDVIVKKLLNLC